MTLTGIYGHRYYSVLEAVQDISARADKRFEDNPRLDLSRLTREELRHIIADALRQIEGLDRLTGDAPALVGEG